LHRLGTWCNGGILYKHCSMSFCAFEGGGRRSSLASAKIPAQFGSFWTKLHHGNHPKPYFWPELPSYHLKSGSKVTAFSLRISRRIFGDQQSSCAVQAHRKHFLARFFDDAGSNPSCNLQGCFAWRRWAKQSIPYNAAHCCCICVHFSTQRHC
jgi:hypothetical protein